MSDAFAPPTGDAGDLSAAAKTLGTVATDLDKAEGQTKSAVATAVGEWHGPRTQDFRDAGAGIQAQLVTAATGVGTVRQAVAAYGKALSSTIEQVAALKRQAAGVTSDAETQSRRLPANDPEQDRLLQHAAIRRGQLEQQALELKSDLATLAGKLAASIDMETDMVVPGSAKLTPDQLRRHVDSSLGVSGLSAAAAHGTLTDAQAWAALAAARKAVPKDAVNDDGSVDWKEAVADFNDKYVGPPGSAGGVAVAPAEGWALYRLALNQREVGAVANDLRGAFDEIVGPVMLDFDRGLNGLTDINDALVRFKAVGDAVDSFGPSAETAEAVEKAAAGGLPETGVIGALGKLAAGVAVVGDVLTLIDPGVDNKVEGDALRGSAAANIAGTAMAFAPAAVDAMPGVAALVGINAVADWVPVAGQIVMVGTGLFLAGDYAYHHWDQISHGVSTGYHATTHALGTAAKATGHALSSVGHSIGHALSHVF